MFCPSCMMYPFPHLAQILQGFPNGNRDGCLRGFLDGGSKPGLSLSHSSEILPGGMATHSLTSGLLGYPFPAAHTLDQSCGCSWHPEALGCYVTGLGQTFWFGRYSLQVKNCSKMQPGCLNTHGGEEALGQRPRSAELESVTGPLGSEI